jgi:hypothetical protein
MMIHVKQTLANGMLFTHFTLNEQVEAVRYGGGGGDLKVKHCVSKRVPVISLQTRLKSLWQSKNLTTRPQLVLGTR